MNEEEKRKLIVYRDLLAEMEGIAKADARKNKKERKVYEAKAEVYGLARNILVGNFMDMMILV